MSTRLLHGDCREVLKTLPSESVHCVVCSPPYFGLRDYGTVGQIGLEATPDAYVAEIVAVFREVRRIMRSDATLWCNLGDSYGSGKQLQGIPWRVAFALQKDGWILRQDVIWSKPNPMPESVRDRCTKAHEYLFLLSKSPRYFWDAEAIAEDTTARPQQRLTLPTEHPKAKLYGGQNFVDGGISASRNKRSVWEVATAPFSEAHFATFPPALIEPCILAGCPAKACVECGKPWVREVERISSPGVRNGDGHAVARGSDRAIPNGQDWYVNANTSKTLGFSPSCSCNAATVPGTVLDCFAGAGTTGLVADRLGRNAILIELNADYADMSHRRIVDDAPLFVEVVAA